MERSDLAVAVATQFATLLETAGVNDGDAPTGLGLPLDRALRRIGVALAGPVPAALDEAALALAEYFTLARIRAALGASTDVEAQNARTSKSQLFNQVTALLEDAAARAAALGYAPVAGSGSGAAAAVTQAAGLRIGLDFIEPSPTIAGA